VVATVQRANNQFRLLCWGLFLIMLQVLDILTTWSALRSGYQEANPIAHQLFQIYGEPTVYLGKLLLVMGVVLISWLLSRRYLHIWKALRFSCLAYVAIVTINLAQLTFLN
jgi:hypothetical protein